MSSFVLYYRMVILFSQEDKIIEQRTEWILETLESRFLFLQIRHIRLLWGYLNSDTLLKSKMLTLTRAFSIAPTDSHSKHCLWCVRNWSQRAFRLKWLSPFHTWHFQCFFGGFYFSLIFYIPKDPTQSFADTRQALYHWAPCWPQGCVLKLFIACIQGTKCFFW